MAHSDKTNAQLLFSALRKAGIRDVIISPGSRNAPLIIEAQATGFSPEIIVDERTAGFTALGMAQQTRKPAVLICTSGTAVLNYHPAVAEAFYARIPLIVVSADRPPYRIDKGEGQTIRQDGVLDKHTLYSVTLPLNGSIEESSKNIKQAVETACQHQGPVHINIPFEEPLYGTTAQPAGFPYGIKIESPETPVADKDLDQLETTWKSAGRKLFIVAQLYPTPILKKQLERLSRFDDVVILTENISNIKSGKFFEHIDRLIFPLDPETWEHYAPDLVVTLGNNIISKKIKFLLREQKRPLTHWHIGNYPFPPDTFDALKAFVRTTPEMFLSQLLFRIYDFSAGSDYAGRWNELRTLRQAKHTGFVNRLPFGDMAVYHALSKLLPEPYHVQWGNSTVVRYAQLFDFPEGIKHFSNRGTSGIDGSVSTAVGAAKKSRMPVLAVVGDLSFRYDINALWQSIPGNLKIIVVNNGGGDIFNFIPGPSGIHNYERYFVYKYSGTLKKRAESFGLEYEYFSGNEGELAQILQNFLSATTRILEIHTASVPNAEILKDYFAFLK